MRLKWQDKFEIAKALWDADGFNNNEYDDEKYAPFYKAVVQYMPLVYFEAWRGVPYEVFGDGYSTVRRGLGYYIKQAWAIYTASKDEADFEDRLTRRVPYSELTDERDIYKLNSIALDFYMKKARDEGLGD